MGGSVMFLLLTLLVVQPKSLTAQNAACSMIRCQCSRNPHMPYNDVICFVPSITAADPTVTELPSDVQSLILSCSTFNSLSFLSAGIFEKFQSLLSLTIDQCNISVLTADSFRGLHSLTNLSVSESGLPLLADDTFIHLSNLQFLTVVFCNLSTLLDISSLKSLRYLNISHNNLHHIEVKSSGATKDADTLDEAEFLNNLTILDLSYNNISSTPVSLIKRTPHVQEVYLKGLCLTQLVIPENIELKDLTILDAKENLLQVVDFISISTATSIKELRLDGAGLPQSLHGLSYLINMEELSLNNFAINDTIWQELNSTALARLNFTKNNVTTIDVSGLPTLKVLHVAKNRILYLTNTTFINQPNLLLVNLSDNNVQLLPGYLFKNNVNLKFLDLSWNNISSFQYESVRGLNQLLFLDLSQNIISNLPYVIFKDLFSMMYLYLNGNQLKELPRLTYMQELLELDISNNQITIILPHYFSGLQKLESLLVNDNKLTIIPPDLLSQCQSVVHVYLHNNKITDLGSLGAHPKLRILTLDNNQLTDFISESPFIRLINLEYLFLGANNFTTLKPNTFPPTILTIFLDENSIQSIYFGSFDNLPRLSFVSLTRNKYVIAIPESVVNVFKNHLPKPTFNIEQNVFVCDCNMGYLKVMSEGTLSISVLNVYYPRFVGIENSDCYIPYEGGIFQPFKDVPLSHFVCEYDETWCDIVCGCCFQTTKCECALTCPSECKCIYGGSWFVKLFIHIHCRGKNLDRVPSGIPSRTVILYLDGNKFGHLSKMDIDDLQETEEIYLNSSGIQSIENGAFDNTTALHTLLLNDNLLTMVSENLFGKMDSVKQIYLHNNLINNISPEAFSALSSVETITLHNNRLLFLTAVPAIPHPMSLTLSGNPWSCNCDVSKVIMRTIYQINEVIEDIDKMCCFFYNNSFLNHTDNRKDTHPTGNTNDTAIITYTVQSTGSTDGLLAGEDYPPLPSDSGKDCLPLLRFSYEDHCIPRVANSTILVSASVSSFHPGFIALIVVVTMLLLLASAVVFVLVKRQELQAWVYVKLGVRILDKKAHLDKEDAGLKVFDAFISYSSKDDDFVARTLVPALENEDRKYRLCVHYRDFPIGRNITDTIYRAIQNSSRTILLLSENFLNSEWCRFEFQTAHHYILREGCHRLIVVILEDIPEELLDLDLKVHLKSKTYLKYGDPWFWEKLYFALPSIKDSQGRKENWRTDILRGMRILAGEEVAEDEINPENQLHREHEVNQEIIGQELDIFCQVHNNVNFQQQAQKAGNENKIEERVVDCDRKLLMAHTNVGFVNVDDVIDEDNFGNNGGDLVAELSDDEPAKNDLYRQNCEMRKVRRSIHNHGSIHNFNDQSYSRDNDNSCLDYNEDPSNVFQNNMHCVEFTTSQGSNNEINDDGEAEVSRKTLTMIDDGKEIHDESTERTNGRGRGIDAIKCDDDDDDEDETCAYYVDDGRRMSNINTCDGTDETCAYYVDDGRRMSNINTCDGTDETCAYYEDDGRRMANINT